MVLEEEEVLGRLRLCLPLSRTLHMAEELQQKMQIT